MPFNVLLPPLLGGYIFIRHWYRTKYYTERYSGERLIFHSAVAGLIRLIIAYGVVLTVRWIWPTVVAYWKTFVPFAYAGTSAGIRLRAPCGLLPRLWPRCLGP